MKIGILSMQRVYNYGSFLQSYALKKLVESMGHEVKFVDIEYAKKRSENVKKTKLANYIKKLKYVDKYFFRRMEYSKRNHRLNQLFSQWQKEYLGMESVKSEADDCDGVIIGSDEIFNCDSHSVWGITGQRFGEIEGVSLVFSYAASCGYTTFEDVEEKDKKIISNALGKMKAISVRDKNTYDFVKKMGGEKIEFNLDPVLVYNFEEEIEAGMKQGVPQQPYMVVYAYHNRIDSQEEIKNIKMYAKKHNLKTIAIGGSLPWCDEFALISPFQVLAYFKNATCIVTDTFHGTVIAAKLNKPFAVLVRESNANKLDDLLNRLNIEEHSVKKSSELEEILNKMHNYDVCNKIIMEEKKHTKAYLKQAIEM